MVEVDDEDLRRQGQGTFKWPKEWTFWGESGRRARPYPWLLIGGVLFAMAAVIGIALGVGLGLGLKKSTTPSGPDLSPYWGGCSYYFRISDLQGQVVR